MAGKHTLMSEIGKKEKYVVFFDLDHTILNNHSARMIAIHAYKERLLSNRDLFLGYLFSLLHKLHIVKPEFIMNRMTRWLKGLSVERFEELVAKVYKQAIAPSIRSAARLTVEKHKKDNARTVILSAAMSQVCTPVRKALAMHDKICTEMEIADGKFTGFSKGKICYGQEKLLQAEEYCQTHNYSLKNAYYYADSISDKHLLEAVGHPVCVTPDIRLSRIAHARGWPVLEW